MRTDLIIGEALAAEKRYGAFTSAHEAYGVLAEEMAELLEAIHRNDLPAIHHEAAQVSAVAMRLANENGEDFIRRSGCLI